MVLFLSTYTNKIDKKGRVSVPASFRQALYGSCIDDARGEASLGFVLFPSFKHKALEGCSLSRMEALSRSVDQFDQFSDTYDDMAAALFADAYQLAFDNEGRILLPQPLRDYADIKEAVAFVGRGASFQLWNPEAFATFQAAARRSIVATRPSFRITPAAESPQRGGGDHD